MRIRFAGLVFGVFGLMIVSACAHASLTVVESVPLETNLAVSGVQDTQSAWLELIGSAKSTIDLEEFYVNNGDSLTPVLNALQDAANRGVQIRLLTDSQFYQTYTANENAIAALPNTQFKTIDFSKSGGIMHAKYFVVDGKSAYVGSANFDWLALSHIHEVGVKVYDAQIASGLESVFNLDWNVGNEHFVSFKTQLAGILTTPALQLFASPTNDLPSGMSPTLNALLGLINNARHSLKIQMYEYATTPYQSSTRFEALDQALRNAAGRGVQVEMIVDKTALKAGSSDLKSLAKVPNLKIKVITIPQWSGGPLQYARVAHSKYLIADDQTIWIGSENWTGDYFTSSRNVGVITTDQGALSSLEQIFTQVSNSGYTTAP